MLLEAATRVGARDAIACWKHLRIRAAAGGECAIATNLISNVRYRTVQCSNLSLRECQNLLLLVDCRDGHVPCRAVPCGSCANAAQSMRDERGAHTQKFLLLQAARRGESTECVSSVSGGLVT